MKKRIDPAIEDYLTEFGLSEREIALYIALLQSGPNTIMNLSRETGIKRSTTHNNVEELIKKGLVSQTNYGERRMVVAENPDKLKLLLDQKKYQVEKLADQLQPVVLEIEKMVPKTDSDDEVTVKYFDGKEGASIIYKEAFASEELRSYVNLGEVYKVFPENENIYKDSKKQNPKLKVWEIIDSSEESEKIANTFKKSDDFLFKSSSQGLALSAIDILIFDNTVAMINFKDNIKGTVIKNTAYFENSKAIFDFFWEKI